VSPACVFKTYTVYVLTLVLAKKKANHLLYHHGFVPNNL